MRPADSARPVAVITRSSKDSRSLMRAAKKAGFFTYELPTINLVKVPISKKAQSALDNLNAFRYVIFTSAHGVDFFCETTDKLKDGTIIIAVGDATAARLNQYGLKADHVPTRFNAQGIANMIAIMKESVHGARILIPCSKLTDRALGQTLEQMGACVTVLPFYTARPILKRDPIFEELLTDGRVGCITFTSPSTVEGFSKRLGDSILMRKANDISVLCIGPTTARAAAQRGFKNIIVSENHTVSGMADALMKLVQMTNT